MKRAINLFLIVAVMGLSGCASVQQMQTALYDIDGFWGKQKYKILTENGRKVLPMPYAQAERVTRTAAESLGFKRSGETVGKLTYRAVSPAPFTEDEYKQIRMIEEPIMQAMAATHVGSFTSSFFVLSSGDTYTVVYLSLMPDGTDKTVVSVDFMLEWIKGKKQAGMILGENPPPEAVRRGLDKFWKAVAENS
jgi:hypothetical protein